MFGCFWATILGLDFNSRQIYFELGLYVILGNKGNLKLSKIHTWENGGFPKIEDPNIAP